jgi:hypothetical protein
MRAFIGGVRLSAGRDRVDPAIKDDQVCLEWVSRRVQGALGHQVR